MGVWRLTRSWPDSQWTRRAVCGQLVAPVSDRCHRGATDVIQAGSELGLQQLPKVRDQGLVNEAES